MENLKGILMEFITEIMTDKQYHSLENEEIVDRYLALKYRPREPEAINRNERSKEFCECKVVSMLYINQFGEKSCYGCCLPIKQNGLTVKRSKFKKELYGTVYLES